MNIYQALVVGENLIPSDRSVDSDPLIVGDEGVVILSGDPDELVVALAADDQADAERRLIATFGDVTINGLQPFRNWHAWVPPPAARHRVSTGFANIAHAFTRCDDPDCEIHHPEVIEDVGAALTAMAWYEAGRRSALLPRCDDCEKELDEDDLRSTAPNLCDSCEQQRRYDKASR